MWGEEGGRKKMRPILVFFCSFEMSNEHVDDEL